MHTGSTLAELSGSAATHIGKSVPAPSRRWVTRIALPLSLVIAAAGLLGYSARRALLPATSVRVAPVVTREAEFDAVDQQSPSGPATPLMTVQAPGWIEPDPFAVSVSALADGVVRDILVLEGECVEAGQVVARMIADDAKIALQAAEAAVAVKQAERAAAESRVHVAEAQVLADQAMADEIRDEVDRKRPLAEDETIPAGDYRRLVLRLAAQDARVKASQSAVGEMKSLVMQAAADVRMAETGVNAAKLTLDRMEIRAPVAGVVLARLAEPGSRMMSGGQDPAGSIALRLYDPARLQVRVDIPLADAAKVGVGHEAQITTEALPDVTFNGRVTRLVQEANIQKNTVQVKVAILNPSPELRPEMLARVKFYRPASPSSEGAAPAASTKGGSLRTYVPESGLVDVRDERARVWVLDEAESVASLRDVALGRHRIENWREAISGVSPGDRVIIDPPATLTPTSRLRVESADLPSASQERGRS